MEEVRIAIIQVMVIQHRKSVIVAEITEKISDTLMDDGVGNGDTSDKFWTGADDTDLEF